MADSPFSAQQPPGRPGIVRFHAFKPGIQPSLSAVPCCRCFGCFPSVTLSGTGFWGPAVLLCLSFLTLSQDEHAQKDFRTGTPESSYIAYWHQEGHFAFCGKAVELRVLFFVPFHVCLAVTTSLCNDNGKRNKCWSVPQTRCS